MRWGTLSMFGCHSHQRLHQHARAADSLTGAGLDFLFNQNVNCGLYFVNALMTSSLGVKRTRRWRPLQVHSPSSFTWAVESRPQNPRWRPHSFQLSCFNLFWPRHFGTIENEQLCHRTWWHNLCVTFYQFQTIQRYKHFMNLNIKWKCESVKLDFLQFYRLFYLFFNCGQ